MSKPKKKRYSKYCCLYTCSNKSIKESEFVFFNVPKEAERRREWLEAIDREDLLDEKTNKAKFNYVCSAHFDDSAMISTTTVFTRLQSDAIPTKLLPHKPSKVQPSPKSKKGQVVPTYSHTQCQTEDDLFDELPNVGNTDTESKPRIVFMNIEPDSAKSNQTANKFLNKNQAQKSFISEPTTSKKFSKVNNNKIKSNTVAASTQTDSYENLKYPRKLITRKPLVGKEKHGFVRASTRKRKTETNIEFVECKRPRSEDIVIKEETEVQSKNESSLSHYEDKVIKKIRKMVMWQSKMKKNFNGYRHDAKYKMFALNLYYSSPQAYCCFQKLLTLPSKSTLLKYKFTVTPKVDDSAFDSISLKIKSLPKNAKYCTICIGEMPLKTNLYYDIKKDQVVGFQNVDGTISPEVASKAYVIMLQGIYCNWKQPVAYALLGSSSHYAALDAWINKVILKLFRAGVQVKAIVSEQGSYFDKYAKVSKNVTIDKPYFFLEEHKIFYIFDVPNLLKCVRDNLITSDLHLKEYRISWDYIKTLYEHQKENNFILIPKITKDHVEPNNLDNIKNNSFVHVAQIFSQTMNAALETYIDFGKLNADAKGTAKFIKVMNGLFDLLNSDKVKSSKKYKCALNMTGHQKAILLDAQHMFASIKSINRQTGEDNTKQIETFYNFQISIQSILQLFKDLKSEGFDYVFTRRLNQENLLFLFQSISENCGSCSEPTPIQFSRAFTKLFHEYMLRNDEMNCETDIYEMLQRAEDIVDKVTHNPIDPDRPSLVTLNGVKDYRIVLPDTDALTYVAAYLIFKCYQIHSNCKKFHKKLGSSSNLEIRNTNYKAFNKTKSFYGYLKMPSEEILQYIKKLEACFIRNFQQILGEKSGSEIFKLLQKIQLPTFPCLCFPVDYLLRLFVRLRIFTTLKYNNRNFKLEKKSIKQHLKVKSL